MKRGGVGQVAHVRVELLRQERCVRSGCAGRAGAWNTCAWSGRASKGVRMEGRARGTRTGNAAALAQSQRSVADVWEGPEPRYYLITTHWFLPDLLSDE